MPITAFLLVVLAAFAHSTWNFLAKRAAHSKHLICFSSATEALLSFPIAAWGLTSSWSQLGLKTSIFLLATGILHLLYTESLLRGYRAGDFSMVYPLARGTGPLLSFFGAVLVLHERLSLMAATGALLLTIGIFTSSGGLTAVRHKALHAGLFWGVATGFTIATYTLIDAYSVRVLLISPFLVEYAGNLFRTIVLAVNAYRKHDSLSIEYRRSWREASLIAILTPIGYILVLFAMRLAPVSHVAPVREMSMMIGVFLGAKFLDEGDMVRRITGSVLIVAGVACLAFA